MLYYKNEKELINMLTKSEEEILDLLWTENRPMTSTEIVNLSVNRTWKKSYIHLLINSLLKKEVIKVESLERHGKQPRNADIEEREIPLDDAAHA